MYGLMQEYDELLEEFMKAVKINYGEKILIQFEDFANHNAFSLLNRYRTTHLVFNDDIQVIIMFELKMCDQKMEYLTRNIHEMCCLFCLGYCICCS